MAALPIISIPSKLSKEGKVSEKYVVDEIDKPRVAHNEFSDDIPVISLAGIDKDNRRSEVLRQVVAAAEEWGIFQVVDHGVDDQLLSMMSTLSKEFFALPDEEKLRYRGSLAARGGFVLSTHHNFMSNGRFKSAEHRAITNANDSRVAVVAFQEPISEAMVYPLSIRKGETSLLEEPITFSEMVDRHTNRLHEIDGLKKLAHEENWSPDILQNKLDQLN